MPCPVSRTLACCLFALCLAVSTSTSALVFDDEYLHIGLYGPMTTQPAVVLGSVVVDFELHSTDNPPKREFHFGCPPYGHRCNTSSGLIPPGVTVPNRHPDLKLKFHFGDSNDRPVIGARTALEFAYGNAEKGIPPVNAVVGGSNSDVAATVASILGVLETVQVAFAATSPDLSNKDVFPYFLRTVTSVTQEAGALWTYVQMFRWRTIKCLYLNNNYGRAALESMTVLAQEAGRTSSVQGFTLPFTEVYDEASVVGALSLLTAAQGRLVVLQMNQPDVEVEVRGTMLAQGVCPPYYQIFSQAASRALVTQQDAWVGWNGWHTVSIFPTFDSNFFAVYYKLLYTSPEDVIAWMEEYRIDDWIVPLDKEQFTEEFMRSAAMIVDSALTASAVSGSVHSVMWAANRMLHDGYRMSEIHGAPLLEYIRNVSFDGYGFPVKFDENQDGSLVYNIDFLENAEPGGAPEWRTFGTWSTLVGLPQNISLTPLDGIRWATGHVSWTAPLELVACPPGTSVDSATGTCNDCPPGRVSIGYDEAECSHCDAGRYSVNTTHCMECGWGEFSVPGSAQCTYCPSGTFTARMGTAQCQNCEVGRYTSLEGQDSCQPCDPGMFRDQLGGQECELCAEGSFTDKVAESECSQCQPGQFQSAKGMTACGPCEPGSFTSEAGMDECALCPPGFYQPSSGANETCLRCEVGWFSSTRGATSCEQCPFGTTPYPGASASSSCGCPKDQFQLGDLGLAEGCAPCNEFMEYCPGFGQAEPRQLEGYYVDVAELQAYKCVSDEACPGGPLGYCPEGSSGKGCAECETLEYFWNGQSCEACGATNVFYFIGLPLGGTIAILLTHWLGNDPIKRSLSNVSEVLVLLGLNMTVFFYLSTAATLDVEWKEPLKSVLFLTKSLAIDASVNFACTLGSSALLDFTVVSLLPMVYMMIAAVLGAVRIAKRRKLVNTFFTLINAAFLIVVLQALKPFRYVVHPNGDKAVFASPSVFEGSAEHMGLVAVSITDVLIYCVVFVASCVYAIWYMARGSAMDRKRTMTSHRFLFYKFKPEAYYWGLVVIARNTGFAVAPSLWPERPHIQVLMLAVISSISAAHTSQVQPWKVWWMNLCDVIILLFINLVLLLAMALLPEDDSTAGGLATMVALCFAMVLFGMTAPLLRSLWFNFRACSPDSREALMEKFSTKEEKFEASLESALSDGRSEDLGSIMQEIMPAHNAKPKKNPSQGVLHPALRRISQQSVDKHKIAAVAARIREPSYSLLDFQEDCIKLFPELELYSIGEKAMGTQMITGGRTAAEEELRTIGALFAVYWICRLDMDGREGLAFGIDEHLGVVNKASTKTRDETLGMPWGPMKPPQRRAHFYYTFNFDLISNLFLQAKITKLGPHGKLEVDASPDGRLVSMLVLTAIHDIMKNDILCPKVEGKPYEGFNTGEVIFDHDLALAYILDRHPTVLPSFAVLTKEQKHDVRFTQSEMGFNAGWLVQAEGPPSAVLSKLKRVVEKDRAHNDAIAFYFAHWLTDLAGAEPTPLTGTEKFAVKFPPHVLQSLLGCFDIVKELGEKTETEVYEEYMKKRWIEAKETLGPCPVGQEMVAKLRLHCMAQASATQVLEAWDNIPLKDREVLSEEMAETGILHQEFNSGSHHPDAGTPFLLYYGPAWVQRAGAVKPELALRVLAAVYRLARTAWPESYTSKEQEEHAGVGSRTVQVDLLKTMDLGLLEAMFPIINDETKAVPVLQVHRRNDMEGVLEGFEYEV